MQSAVANACFRAAYRVVLHRATVVPQSNGTALLTRSEAAEAALAHYLDQTERGVS